MLIVIFGAVIFFWLVLGAVQYLICVAVPRLRQFALSAALWWAVWGTCCVGLMMLAGLAFVTQMFVAQERDVERLHAPHLLAGLGWGYVVIGSIGSAAVATNVAWFHQAIVRRVTFALFRIYATLVSAGIGSVFGWCFSWWTLYKDLKLAPVLGLSAMLILVGAFGTIAYKNARALRGEAPTTLALVSREEFEG